jgi:general secretion pathway protein M
MSRTLFSLHTPRARASFAVGFCAVLVFAPMLLAVGYLAHKTLWAVDALDVGEPRLARLIGLREAGSQVTAARALAEDRLARFSYPASAVTDRIGAELQQRLRNAADSAGVSVSGSQVIKSREEDGLEQIPVSINFEATHEQLQHFLQALSAQSPAVFVDSLTLTPMRQRTALDRLMVQGRFSVLRRTS